MARRMGPRVGTRPSRVTTKGDAWVREGCHHEREADARPCLSGSPATDALSATDIRSVAPVRPWGFEMLAQHCTLPWSAYVRLLAVKDSSARQFYETDALRWGWSVRQLDRQIGSQFYERTALSRNEAAMLQKGAVQTPAEAVLPDDEVKDSYVMSSSA